MISSQKFYFVPNISQSDNSIKEKRSVLLIENLLIKDANTNISREDKKANIDGEIELLDESQRPCGKIVVQVKTVNKRDEGLFRFPCPTSLFGYAERTTDNVFLLAVDHSLEVVLFKYISRKLIKDNAHKSSQETITLYFDEHERLSKKNVESVLNHWKDISHTNCRLLTNGEKMEQENQRLKNYVKTITEKSTTLTSKDIEKIQFFIGTYNKFLDNEFSFVKETYFPNIWKRGIAISKYSDSELLVSLFSIKKGELMNQIIELPPIPINEQKEYWRYDYSIHSCNNYIEEDGYAFALRIVKKDLEQIIKKQKIIPGDVNIIMEYLWEFVQSQCEIEKGKIKDSFPVDEILQPLLDRFPQIINGEVTLQRKGSRFSLHSVYLALISLKNLGISQILRPYPQKGHYGKSGMISDCFTPELAFEKFQIVVRSAIKAYQDFVFKSFAILFEELDLYSNSNLIIGIFKYSEDHSVYLNLLFFRRLSPDNSRMIIFENLDSPTGILNGWKTNLYKGYSNQTLFFNGICYEFTQNIDLNSHHVLYDKRNMLEVFYDFLNDKIKRYFEKIGILKNN